MQEAPHDLHMNTTQDAPCVLEARQLFCAEFVNLEPPGALLEEPVLRSSCLSCDWSRVDWRRGRGRSPCAQRRLFTPGSRLYGDGRRTEVELQGVEASRLSNFWRPEPPVKMLRHWNKIGVFTQMMRRQNFDATPGMDRTIFLVLFIGCHVKFDTCVSKFLSRASKKSVCVKTPVLHRCRGTV